jgi:hypothetical protein
MKIKNFFEAELKPVWNTLHFWGRVFIKAFCKSLSFSEFKDGLIAITRGLIINIPLFLGVSAVRGISYSDVVDILTSVGLVIVIRFVWFLFYIPSKLYFDKKQESFRLTWVDVEFEEFYFKDSNYGVGVKVTSKKRKEDEIWNATAKISNIRKFGEIASNSFPARLAWVNGTGSNSNLVWSSTELHQDEPAVLLIAMSKDNKGWITTENSDRNDPANHLENMVHYSFDIEFSGQLGFDGYSLMRKTLVCDVVYDSANNKFRFKIIESPTHFPGYGGSKSQPSDFDKID